MKIDRWEFYIDNNGLYRWRLINAYSRIIGMALNGFSNRDDCLEDARLNGFSDEVTALLFTTI
jgi:uncharacterized protein YegP (UPF0339 family)